MTKFKVEEKNEYSKLTGLKKSIKNNLIVYLLPALLYLINGYADWMPEATAVKVAPLIGVGSYYLKNYIEMNTNIKI